MKGYRRKLFWGACALETVSLLFFLCACAAIAFAVTVENISASYELRLQSIDKQAVSRLEASEEFIRIAAEQSLVTEACRSFFSPSSALQQSEAFLDLRAALVQLSHNHPQFQFSFFLTRSYFARRIRLFSRSGSSFSLSSCAGSLRDGCNGAQFRKREILSGAA